MKKIATIAAGIAATAVLVLSAAPAQAGTGPTNPFPGPVHPCLQEPCPPGTSVPDAHSPVCVQAPCPGVQVQPVRKPVLRPHWAHHSPTR